MLTIDTNKLKENTATFTLSSTDEVFKDTKYADMDFTITIKKPARSEAINIMSKSAEVHNGKFELNQGVMTKEIFCASVKSWEGINDQDGKPLPCNNDIKGALWESSDFIDLTDAITSAIESRQKHEAEKVEAVKGK